jgi:hypothetical protein
VLSPFQFVALFSGSVAAVFAQADFSGTITLGSVLLAVVVLVAAGFFTVRSNVAAVWRQEAEGQKARADRADEHALEIQAQMLAEREEHQALLARERDEQQVVRHNLRNELAAVTLQLDAEKRKPDLSVLVELQKENYAKAMQEVTTLFEGVTRTQQEMLAVLQKLADKQ